MVQSVIEKKIMWGDLDSLGIVFYPRYYEWIDGCSHIFFEKLGLNLGDLWKKRNVLFGLVNTSCSYFKPGRYHQDIRITTWIDKLEQKTLTIKHIIEDVSKNITMVEGIEKRICMTTSDTEDLKATDIPKDIYKIFRESLPDK